jgi:hypothetical protein
MEPHPSTGTYCVVIAYCPLRTPEFIKDFNSMRPHSKKHNALRPVLSDIRLEHRVVLNGGATRQFQGAGERSRQCHGIPGLEPARPLA